MISDNRTDEGQLQASCRKAEQPAGAAKAAASSRHWPPSTESRIVRVSRMFGGKDRHSKVRTVKGLRDRRVRLSVPTAIQLYDLQDRLGLNQPSKVVDWLINAAQREIEKLPQLHFPPQDLLGHHVPSSMALPPFSAVVDHAAAAASMLVDGDKAHCNGDLKEFMSLNNSLGMVNGGTMPSYYTAAESWGNGNVHELSHRASPQLASHHSPFPSLLSLAPGSQLVFYSSEGGYAMKEAADQFPVDSLDDQLSLSSARSFLHSGSHG